MKRSRSDRGLIEGLEGRTLLSLVFNELTPLPDSIDNIVQFQGAWYYYSPTEQGIYRTDGTTAGTSLVHRFVDNGAAFFSNFGSLEALPNMMVFTIDDDEHGQELWGSNGTDAGTVMLKDINPDAASSFPSAFEELNGRLFFTADDGTHGRELWVTNGTSAGTQLVKDINTENNGADSSGISNLTAAGNLVYFQADQDGEHPYALWRSDGTAAGTLFVADMLPASNPTGPQDFLGLPTGQVLVLANEAQLWTTNGTTASLVTGTTGMDTLRNLESVGNMAVFTGSSGWTQRYLWATDGAAGNTAIIHTFPDGASLGNFEQVDNSLFFTVSVTNNDTMLWKTDGTAAGTVPVQVQPGAQDFEGADGSMFYLVPRINSSNVPQAFRVWQINGSGQSTFQGEVPVPTDWNSASLETVGSKAFITLIDTASEERFYASALPSPMVIFGTKRNDTLGITIRGDVLTWVLNGKKHSVARSSFSTLRIDTGAGNDRVVIGKGITGVFLNGGTGNDVLIGSSADNVMDGGPGNDLLMGRGGTDRLTGGLGKDIIVGGGSNDVIIASAARDTVHRQAILTLTAIDNPNRFFKLTGGMSPSAVFDEIIQPGLQKAKKR